MNNQHANEGINLLLQKFTDTWNHHDVKAFALVFDEDADFTNVFGQSFFGRPAIEAQHAPLFSTMFKASHFAPSKTNIRLLTHNLAAVDVVWQMSGATDRQGNPWPERKGLMSLIVKNEAENWQILVMHNMDLPAGS